MNFVFYIWIDYDDFIPVTFDVLQSYFSRTRYLYYGCRCAQVAYRSLMKFKRSFWAVNAFRVYTDALIEFVLSLMRVQNLVAPRDHMPDICSSIRLGIRNALYTSRVPICFRTARILSKYICRDSGRAWTITYCYKLRKVYLWPTIVHVAKLQIAVTRCQTTYYTCKQYVEVATWSAVTLLEIVASSVTRYIVTAICNFAA